MKRDKIEKILKVLRSGANTTAAILDELIWTYPEARRDMHRFIKYGGRPPRIGGNKEFLSRQNQQFYSLLNQLKNQGFIEKEIKSKSSFWKITRKGIDKLKNRKEKQLFFKSSIQYKKILDDKLKVIIFDIPEKERHKRDWLRMALIALGFSFLQQSVWIGRNKIPELFVIDLRERELLSCVEIFEVGQKGTIARKNF